MKISPFLIMPVFMIFIGCGPTRQPDLKDAEIRSQLLSLPQAPPDEASTCATDLGALLSVSGAKMSPTQYKLVVEARDLFKKSAGALETFRARDFRDDDETKRLWDAVLEARKNTQSAAMAAANSF
jgi:hypothetical protein